MVPTPTSGPACPPARNSSTSISSSLYFLSVAGPKVERGALATLEITCCGNSSPALAFTVGSVAVRLFVYIHRKPIRPINWTKKLQAQERDNRKSSLICNIKDCESLACAPTVYSEPRPHTAGEKWVLTPAKNQIQLWSCGLGGREGRQRKKPRGFAQLTLHPARCTMHTVHCTLYTEKCTLHTAHCRLYTAHCTLYTVHYTL